MLGETVHPQALHAVLGGQGHRDPLPELQGSPNQASCPPTLSGTGEGGGGGRCCLEQGASGTEGALCWNFRHQTSTELGLPLNSRHQAQCRAGPEDPTSLGRGGGLGRRLGVKVKLGEGSVSTAESWEGHIGTGRRHRSEGPLRAQYPQHGHHPGCPLAREEIPPGVSAATGSPVPMQSPTSPFGHLSGDSGPETPDLPTLAMPMAGHGAPRVPVHLGSPPLPPYTQPQILAHTQPPRTSSQSSLSRGACWSRGLQEGQRGPGAGPQNPDGQKERQGSGPKHHPACLSLSRLRL